MNDISARKKLEEELFHQANTYAMTWLINRRHFIFQAEQEIRRAKRFNRELSVIMMDLDHFKKVNDEFGHAVGDIVLATLAKASLESLRASDIIGRVGGEEFAVLLPETGLAAAQEVAERILQHVQETPIKAGRRTVHCTTSLGVAHMTNKDKSIDDILVRADKALYKAKETGRNRIVVQKH
jgi:diguanylate cyclase (GGDEF)-like protein